MKTDQEKDRFIVESLEFYRCDLHEKDCREYDPFPEKTGLINSKEHGD